MGEHDQEKRVSRPLRGEFLETFYRQAVDPNIPPSVEPTPCVVTEKIVRPGFGYLDYIRALNIDKPLARVESRAIQVGEVGSALGDVVKCIKSDRVEDSSPIS